MSCSSLKHRFEEQRKKGISFEQAMEIYQDLEGSVAAHRAELQELQNTNADQNRIAYLQQHVADGEALLNEIRSMKLQ
ncbi:MAG: hypothetical protein H0Z39_04045 [Peptococcaceae bacterium]|nr:hypothetical protein [Peptococcaceae bacterium]